MPKSKHYAEGLEAALQRESDPVMRSRYQFDLAQSYRERGEKEKALQAYLKRAELGFWTEEVFVSLYSAAKLQEALGRPFDEVIATYLRAANAVPSRVEALHGASRYCRLSKRYKEGYEIAKRVGLSGEVPDSPFVEPWIYEYGLLDEFAINAYWAGAYQDCLDACERILRERKCPEEERPRIEKNAAFARQQLGIEPSKPSSTPYYSDAFFDQQSAGSLATARIILKELTTIVPIRSVVDVGCGVGPWLRAALELGVARAIGLDGDYVDPGRLMVEPTFFRPCNLEVDGLAQVLGGEHFDLAMSLEVAEHLPADRARSFVAELCSLSNLFLFSAAIPGQGGTDHVNEQWPDYWAALFQEHGCACFDVMRPRLWYRDECEWWYIQNVLVFARRNTAAFEVASRFGAPVLERPMRLVHPRMLACYGWRGVQRFSRQEAAR